MRRVLSLVLTAAMLVGGMVIAPTSASAATLDKQNVAAEAYYYGGKVSLSEKVGSVFGGIETGYEIDIKDGDASLGSIVLDGVISKGEWGDPVVVVNSDYAANNNGKKWASNMEYDVASAENTYYYYLNEGDIKAPKKGLSYELYLMWDEDYMYVAAVTKDPDGHQSDKGGEDAWNSDSLQIRFDTKGPNSFSGGKDYDCRGQSTQTPYELFNEPWEGAIYDWRHWSVGERVNNFVFTYTSIGDDGGAVELWDGARRYLPEMVADKDANENEIMIEKWQQHDVSWIYFQDPEEDGDYANYDEIQGGTEGVYGAIYPKNTGTAQRASFTTTYELAIPWDIIEEGYRPTEGAELGVAAALFNSATGANSYNSWLGWGSGIGLDQIRWNPQTVGGSNSLTLSKTPYTTARCAHKTFNPATCQEPETCAECGYKRGFVAGHDYAFSDYVAPTAKTNGTITATCRVCDNVEVKTIAAGDDSVKYSFKTTDNSITGKGFNSGFTTAWMDGPTVDSNRTGNQVFIDGVSKNAFDKNSVLFPGEAVLDLYTNGRQVAPYIDETVTNSDHTGTYFDMENMPTAYTYAMEVYFPEEMIQANDISDGLYNAGIRNSFGDSKGYGFYGAGLYRLEDKWFFGISNCGRGDGDHSTKEGYTIKEFTDSALTYAEATDEDMAPGKWHTYAFMFDEATATAMFAWDGEIKVAATDARMRYNDDDNSITPFFRRYSVGFFARNVAVGGVGLFSDYVNTGDTPIVPGTTYMATIDHVHNDYKPGETVSISAPAEIYDGSVTYKFVCWEGDVDVLADATLAETEFIMPEKDVTLTPKYEEVPALVGDVNDDGAVNMEDSNRLKQILIGNTEVTANADVDGDGSVTTKDSYALKKILVAG